MKTLIAIPCMDMVPVAFATSLINLRKANDTAYAIHANSLIYDSRNSFTANAIEKGYDRILWLDSDMVFEPDLLERLGADMDEYPDVDMVCGLCFKRRIPTGPVIYSELIYERTEDKLNVKAVPMLNYPHDLLFRVKACGFGAVLCKTELLKNVWDKYGPPFDPMTQIGEDLACCWRIDQMGGKIYCDSRVKVGHVGQFVFDEGVYMRQNMAGSETANAGQQDSGKSETEGV